jgi:ABC-2 type transport system ATP-binding protein
LLEINGLCKDFSGNLALAGLDLRLESGKILGLLGPNGSGKSTLLKTIAGLVKPAKGQVRIMGREPGRATKAHVSYLPEVDCLYRETTVAGTLQYFSTFYGDWDASKARHLLSFLELDGRAMVSTLSRGMRARLKLVLALARRAPLVLLDEPLSGIDPRSRSRIVAACVGEYRPEQGSMIIATHEVIQAEGAFDDVVFLDRGKVKLAGSAEELRTRHGKSLEALFEEVYA